MKLIMPGYATGRKFSLEFTLVANSLNLNSAYYYNFIELPMIVND